MIEEGRRKRPVWCRRTHLRSDRRRRVREPGDLEELLEKTKASEAYVRVRDEIV